MFKGTHLHQTQHLFGLDQTWDVKPRLQREPTPKTGPITMFGLESL